MVAQPIPLDFQSGIQRDGTTLDSNRAVDALWTRWRLNRPRKMGGTQRATDQINGIPRQVHMYYSGNVVYTHVGSANGIQQIILDIFGTVQSITDRTPSGFVPSASNDWTLDAIYDTNTGLIQLLAHCTLNAASISNVIQTTPYIGNLIAGTALVAFSDPGSYAGGAWTKPSVAGGIVCVQPYVFDFDAYGLIQWSSPNFPLQLGVTGGTSGAGQARESAQKIVAGMPLRGGGTQQPAAVFWSLSEVIQATFVGSSAGFFAFSTLSSSSSILSGKSVIEYDGTYYWVGQGRFMLFNGTVQELTNQQNADWFFDNLTPGQEQKIYAFKVPRYGEIWFCAPMFGNTECSHAAIVNLREQCWYDTALPDGGRSCGFYAQGFKYPVMGGVVNGANGYKLWLHEIGTDEIDGSAVNPMRSYFETPWIGGLKSQQPTNNGMSIQQFEPDFIQAGDMSVYVIGEANSRAPESSGTPVPLKTIPNVPQEELVSFKETHRLSRLHVESNVIGGTYVAGKNFLHADPTADPRKTS